MAKSTEQFEAEHEAFRARLHEIHSGLIGKTAQAAMNNLRQEGE